MPTGDTISLFDSFFSFTQQYPSDYEVPESAIRESDMQRALPVMNLKKLLEDYVRQATNSYPICVFEVLCWAAFEDRLSMDSNSFTTEDVFTQQQAQPDIVIPFMMQIDIGLRTQVEQYRITPIQTNTKQSMKMNYESSLTSIKDIISDKEFTTSPVDLTVSYVPSTMNASISSSSEGITSVAQDTTQSEITKSDQYTTLSFNNFPMTSSSRSDDAAERNLLANAPHLNFLVMNSQPCKGLLNDAYQSRKRNIRTADAFIEALANPATYDPPQPISAVRVDVSNPRDRFHSKWIL